MDVSSSKGRFLRELEIILVEHQLHTNGVARNLEFSYIISRIFDLITNNWQH